MKKLSLPAALGLLGLLLLAPQARAQRIVIDAVHDGMGVKADTFRPGDPVTLRGRGFHVCKAPEGADLKTWRCGHEGLQVRVDGRPALVTESAADHLTLGLPQQLKMGKRVRIEVSIRGRGSASASVKIGKVAVRSDGGGPSDERTRLMQAVGFTRFELVPGPKGDSFVVEGYARGFPDKLTVQLELSSDGQPVPRGMDQVVIQGERFSHTFGPYEKKVRAGRYQLDLLFELGKQSKRRTRKWVKLLSDTAREVYGFLRRRHTCLAGTPADQERERSRLQAHYETFAKQVLALRDELRAVVADAGRSLYREGRAVNEERYTRWLLDLEFAKDAKAARTIIEAPKYAKASGHFDARAYGAWLKKTTAALDELAKGHQRWNSETLVSLNPKADELAQWLLATVFERLRAWSGKLYTHSKLEPPAIEVSVSLAQPPKLSRRFFDAKRVELLRRVGLE